MAKLIVRMVVGFLTHFRIADKVIETLLGEKRVVVDLVALQKLNKFAMNKLQELPSDVAWASGQIRQDMAARYPLAPYGYCQTCNEILDESAMHGYPCSHCGYAPATLEKVVRYEIVETPETGQQDMFPVFEGEDDTQEVTPTNGEDLLTLTADRKAVEDLLGYLDEAAGGYHVGTFFNSPMRRLYEAMKNALASK